MFSKHAYLKMKMNKIKREKNVATLSIVFNITTYKEKEVYLDKQEFDNSDVRSRKKCISLQIFSHHDPILVKSISFFSNV